MKHQTFLALKVIFQPVLFLIFLIRKLPISWFFELRIHIDGLDRPYYAYGLYRAACEAKALHIPRISTYEFGVAGGHGLLILERLSKQVSRITGVQIDVFGFDLGKGLPKPKDYRDTPHLWRGGFYKMNVEVLRRRLDKSTQLVLGDVRKTVPRFARKKFAPIGFVAFDLDYYSSTMAALKLFDAEDGRTLPRVFCYFDDIVGTDEEVFSEYVGELQAIRKFNDTHKLKKIAKIHGLYHKRVIKSTWSDMMYVMHSFRHKLYNTYIYPIEDRQSVLS
jgi:hypothetical protein